MKRAPLLLAGLALVLASCTESKVVIQRATAVRLDDDRVRVDIELRNVGDDDARRACVKVTWRDEKGIVDTRLTCAEHDLHGGNLLLGDVTELCPESTCPSTESIKTDSHGKIARGGVTIRVEVTRGGDCMRWTTTTTRRRFLARERVSAEDVLLALWKLRKRSIAREERRQGLVVGPHVEARICSVCLFHRPRSHLLAASTERRVVAAMSARVSPHSS